MSSPRVDDTRRPPWPTLALTGGMALALALAAGETVRVSDAPTDLPAHAAARVGDVVITQDELDRATAALASDRRGGQRPDDRAHVLERLVDEALLVELALSHGLPHRDPRTRADLSAAALALLASEAELSEPSEPELERFYGERRGELRGAPQLRVELRFARGPDAVARVMAEGELLDDAPLPVPGGWVSERDLRELVGPSLASALSAAEVGVWLPPHPLDDGLVRLRVADRRAPEAPPLREVRDEVRALYRRQRGDDAVRAYLERARRDTPIVRRVAPGSAVE